VAIGREDGQVMVVGRRVPPELLRGPAQAPISAVALSPEGRWLAASDLEGNISRWDLTVSTPNPILLSAGRKQQRAWLLKISRNGQRVLACCVSDVVTVWSLEQRAPKLLKEQVASAADLSLDGRWLMVADRLGDIRRFDLTPRDVSVPVSQAKDCTETPWRLAAKQAVKDIRISPDNRWLAAVPQDGIPLLWSLPSKQGESPKPFPPLNGHDRPVAALDFSTDGRLLVTADAAADGTLRLWDLTAPDPSSSTVRHRGVEGYATVAYLTPDGHYLAGGNDRGATDVRDLWGPIDKIVNVQADSYRVVGVMLSSDGRWLLRKTERPHAGTASARIDDVPNEITAGLWDLRDGVAPKHQTDLGDIIDVSADGSSVVTAGSGGLSIWTLPQRGQPVRARTMSFPPGAVPPAGRAFLSPLQHYLVATVRNGVCLWDLSHGSKGVFQTTPVNPISVAAFSNDSRWFAAARNNVASAWMISAGGLNRPIELRGHSKEITAIVFPAEGKNGQEMFTASADGTALLFPIDSIRLRNEAENSYLRLEGHRGPIRTVWANKSGRKLVTGSDDGTAILWNLDRINLVPSPVGGYEEGPIVAGIFGREERSFTTVSSDGTVREWSLDRDALKKEVERIAGRRLTPQEQEAYIPKPHFWPRFLHRGG
jgi:WD40 repeat protein